MRILDLSHVDKAGFKREIDELRAELTRDLGEADLRHLRSVIFWGRVCSVLGYLSACVLPNPLSAFLISQGILTRWMVMHHVGHGGYERVPGVPARLTSAGFAVGARRYLDWLDWMHPEAWRHEHNDIHHMRTGTEADPDLVERNAHGMRIKTLWFPVKVTIFCLTSMVWKFVYYVPSTVREYHRLLGRRAGLRSTLSDADSLRQLWNFEDPAGRAQWKQVFSPWTPAGRQVWFGCLLPYALIRFAVIPGLFALALGPTAGLNVLLTTLLAEAMTNLHAFLIIVPNHTGDDLARFDGDAGGKAAFYLRQVVGSVNMNGGTPVRDFFLGYLNYQIEHHVWPDLPMLKYRQAQPRLQALCAKYGVPYAMESVWARVWRAVDIMAGRRSMLLGHIG
jgi:fatty acid desaturase